MIQQGHEAFSRAFSKRIFELQEVKILKGIRHPNVLFFRGICVNPPMIITELCEHGSVSDVIQLTVRISQPKSTILISAEKREQICEHMQWAGRVRLMLDAAKGMLYLHNKDLLHCDLKSLNLHRYLRQAMACTPGHNLR